MTLSHFFDEHSEPFVGQDGVLRSKKYDDVYFSQSGGLDESRSVFLDGCDLPNQLKGKNQFRICELGFGTGLNFLSLLDLLSHTVSNENWPENLWLDYYGIEKYLLDKDALCDALALFPSVSQGAGALMAQWPKRRFGFDHLHFHITKHIYISLTIAQMDVTKALNAYGGQADAVFLDGFSPSKNPAMWREEILSMVGHKTRAGGRLATFTVAGHVRRHLISAGFEVEKKPGFAKKREKLVAIKGGELTAHKAKRLKVAVIGAGIAGSSLAWHLKNFGAEVTVFDEAEKPSGASANPVGLMTPRLDAGGGPISQLFADCFYYARGFYLEYAPHALKQSGVLQTNQAHNAKDRFEKLLRLSCFARGDLSEFTDEGHDKNTFSLFPEKQDHLSLWLSQAIEIKPIEICQALVNDIGCVKEKFNHIGDIEDLFARGFDKVALASGAGFLSLFKTEGLGHVRGQIEWAEGSLSLPFAVSYGGYVLEDGGKIYYGATHRRGIDDDTASPLDRDLNHLQLEQFWPDLAQKCVQNHKGSRASVRVMTRDYLPIADGLSQHNLYVFTGLGSRGFCLAPLLARNLAKKIIGSPNDGFSSIQNLLKADRKGINIGVEE